MFHENPNPESGPKTPLEVLHDRIALMLLDAELKEREPKVILFGQAEFKLTRDHLMTLGHPFPSTIEGIPLFIRFADESFLGLLSVKKNEG